MVMLEANCEFGLISMNPSEDLVEWVKRVGC